MNEQAAAVQAVVVDDQASQLDYVVLNLEAACLAHGSRFVPIERFDRVEDAIRFVQRRHEPIQVLVTDILWPKPGSTSTRQSSRGLEIIRYTAVHRPETLIVALSMGDEDHKRVALDAEEAGAHIFRFHDADLPGEKGSGWLDLAEDILERLALGPPYRSERGVAAGDRGGYAASPTTIGQPMDLIEHLCRRFPVFAVQLRMRHDNRPTLVVEDEYDVQDALHAILRLHFLDVRDEEPAPSHGDTATRIDLMLKGEHLIIETKMTRASLTQKKLVEEIAIDKERYRAHPDGKNVLFFVYDPGAYLENPNAIERDLAGESGGVTFTVVIAPKESGAVNA